MPVRVMGTCGGSFGDLADAIVWSAGGTVDDLPVLTEPQIAKVINLSLGSSASCGATLQEAIDDAVDRGTTIVAAAGNRNKDVSTGAPANCANVIAVAAVDASGTKAIFSNYGEGIAVSAPGVYIVSTLNTGTKEPGEETYGIYEGTSMAAPHVAGVVALVQGRRLALKQPLYSPAKLRSVLTKTAYKLPGKCPGGCGAGIVDAYAAVQSVGHEVGDLISPAIRLLLD
jgi:serine protease